jgi:hypothetical protein
MNSQIEHPEKIYTLKSGKIVNSEQMAAIQEYGIKRLNGELKSATNPRKVKELRNILR